MVNVGVAKSLIIIYSYLRRCLTWLSLLSQAMHANACRCQHVLWVPITTKLFYLNFHPLEVVSRWRDPQLQVSENYSDLTKWRSTNFKSCWLMSLFIFNRFKSCYVMCYKKCKKRILTARAVKGLTTANIIMIWWIFSKRVLCWSDYNNACGFTDALDKAHQFG